ncbi:MAG TPA: SEC-C metal-binding domain-containing protein [Isosphaeraceae bacterium]|nr:SEC-C metal-binding domain-containing protein [Isosphaeraceae bacterium]
MGALADAFVAYAQPLLDQTDGSEEQLNKAFAISQLCYNLALLPDDRRDTMLSEMRQTLGMDDAEFAEFRRSVIVPMIRRHEEMFPGMHRRTFGDSAPSSSSLRAPTRKAAPRDRYPGTDRYAPCPCGSGEKYKFCCGAKGR